MRCRKIISYLNAYADGELSEKLGRIVEIHLSNCTSCQKRLEEIRGLTELFDGTLPAPPPPEGFAARIMAEARRRQPVKAPEGPSPLPAWNPLRWIAGFSTPMRLAVCATILLAIFVGMSLGGRNATRPSMLASQGKSLYGLEWFAPEPPDSIGSVYVALVTQTDQGGINLEK